MSGAGFSSYAHGFGCIYCCVYFGCAAAGAVWVSFCGGYWVGFGWWVASWWHLGGFGLLWGASAVVYDLAAAWIYWYFV